MPPIEVLEQLLQTSSKSPIRKLLEPCLAAADETRGELRALSGRLADVPGLARFPKLRALVLQEVGDLIATAHAQTTNKLAELVSMEENYICTEDSAFLQVPRALPSVLPSPPRARAMTEGSIDRARSRTSKRL